jgi:galactokinase
MTVQVYAPGRAELLGNHTDYNEGLVMSFAVGHGTTVKGWRRDDGAIVVQAKDLGRGVRLESGEPVAPRSEPGDTWANYALGVVAGLQELGEISSGFHLEISSNLSMGAGLSSSAALEMATALCLDTLFGLGLPQITLARVGQTAEHRFVGVKCGLLDQISSLMSREQHATYLDCRSYEVSHVPIPVGLRFVVANSGVKHALVAGEYNERRRSCEEAAQWTGVVALRDLELTALDNARRLGGLPDLAWKRARHVVTENARVAAGAALLKSGDAEGFGRLMFESHESSREFFENSCPELDVLVEAARRVPGCLGARLSGGGFGGATINLVKAEAVEDLCQTLRCAGSDAEILVTAPSAGARVISGNPLV